MGSKEIMTDKSNIKYSLILEDDIFIVNKTTFINELNKYAAMIDIYSENNWDMIQLGVTQKKRHKNLIYWANLRYIGNNIYMHQWDFWPHHGLLYKDKAIDTILNELPI